MTLTEQIEDAGCLYCAGFPAFAAFTAEGLYTSAFALRLVGLGTKPSRTSSPEEAQEWESWQ